MITILGGLYIYLVLGVTFYVISYPSPKSKTPETLECSGSVLFGAQFCCLFKKTVGQLPGQLPWGYNRIRKQLISPNMIRKQGCKHGLMGKSLPEAENPLPEENRLHHHGLSQIT